MGLPGYVVEINNYVFSYKLRKALVKIELVWYDVRINKSAKFGCGHPIPHSKKKCTSFHIYWSFRLLWICRERNYIAFIWPKGVGLTLWCSKWSLASAWSGNVIWGDISMETVDRVSLPQGIFGFRSSETLAKLSLI